MKTNTNAYCEYKRGKVARLTNGVVSEFRYEDGGLLGGPISDRVFPDIPSVATISSKYQELENLIKNEEIRSLNWFDIRKKLVSDWKTECAYHLEGKDCKVFQGAQQFTQDIIRELLNIKTRTVSGIPLIRL